MAPEGRAAVWSVDTLLHLGPYLAKNDIDALEFISRLGISPNIFLQHDAWFERDKVLEAGSRLAEVTGIPFAGAFAGNDVPIPNFGTWGTIVSQAETLQQACELVRGKLYTIEQGSMVSLRDEDGPLCLAYSIEGPVRDDPLQILLASVAMLRNVALLYGEADAVRVHLTMPWSYDARHLEEAFGERLIFNSKFNGVEIDNDVLANELIARPTADFATRAIDTTIATATLINQSLITGNTSIHQIAAHLYISVRTLQRRLKYCGVNFEDLLDVSRRDAAVSYLASGASNMSELATRLGYRDPANFTRAFKRWTGKPPTKFFN
ncbi:MAG: AraC family transcriptional regulator ligand-binding domain-containing protein [Hyphomicrobiaceae bacterium]